jgi:hypothetical protein
MTNIIDELNYKIYHHLGKKLSKLALEALKALNSVMHFSEKDMDDLLNIYMSESYEQNRKRFYEW